MIFATDSINRMSKGDFISAFEEYMRILKVNGRIFIEIAMKEYPGVVKNNFDKLISLRELKDLLNKYNMNQNVIDLKFNDNKSIYLNNLISL